jgi:excinuclease UvrABC ATPase subunit
MTGAAYNALRRIGAKSPLKAEYRGSFALLGFTGPGKPAFIQQVMVKCLERTASISAKNDYQTQDMTNLIDHIMRRES